jgi:hypothetical protein
MKKLILSILFIACCFLTAFTQSYPTKALKKTFSEVQLRDIEIIAKYMESLVLYHHPKLDKSTAYHTFFDSLRINFLETDSVDGQLAINELIKYDFLNSLDTSTFHTIWIDDSPLMVRTRDTIIKNPPNYHSLDINNQGKVMNYLKRLGEKVGILSLFMRQLKCPAQSDLHYLPECFTNMTILTSITLMTDFGLLFST